MDSIKQLTAHETYVQALRALNRLRDKRLIYGTSFDKGACCATGAMYAHAMSEEAIEYLDYPTSESRFIYHYGAKAGIRSTNDAFRRRDNTLEAQRARYTYMVKWLKRQIKATKEAENE